MAPDLLSTICHEINERLSELRPLVAEYERLLSAVEALEMAGDQGNVALASASAASESSVSKSSASYSSASKPDTAELAASAESVTAAPARRPTRPARGSVPVAIEIATGGPVGAAIEASSDTEPAVKDKSEGSTRDVVREAILAALDHGSHTVSELAMVTAVGGPSINGNLRKLVAEGAVVKTEREGKAAWALAVAA